MTAEKLTVVVLGASDKKERYSNKAVRRLMAKGYRVIPVHPRLQSIEDLPVVPHLDKIDGNVHTLTMYVGAARSTAMADSIIKLNPGRVIFNPGAENPILESMLRDRQIDVLRACTLVMLQTGQF